MPTTTTKIATSFRPRPVTTAIECMSVSPDFRRSNHGFTLVEMAIAIVLIALLLGSLLVPLQTQVETRRFDDTRRILEQAREALLSYVVAYGYFPCPADYGLVSTGFEAAHTVATGVCLSSGGGSVNAGATPGVY